MQDVLKVASVQVPPIHMNKDETIDRACELIKQAGAAGADLVVFPETYVPGYPYWRSVQPNTLWAEHMLSYQRNSVVVGSEDTDRLSIAAFEADACVVMGCSERSDRKGSETLFNSVLFFERDGRLIGRRRKLTPTHAERMIWGQGDPADLSVMDMSIGRVGALVCYENHVTLFKAAMCALGEEIHCALWPGWPHQGRHPADRRKWVRGDDLDASDVPHAVREYAFETQTFVISASQYIPEDELTEDARTGNLAVGGSMVINPAGSYIVKPVMDRPTVVHAELHSAERMLMKAWFDAQGHYSRWDAVKLELSNVRLGPTTDD